MPTATSFDPLTVLPPLRRPLAGSLIHARQQVLLLAEQAHLNSDNFNMWTQLALAAHETVESYNDYLQDQVMCHRRWREETESEEKTIIKHTLRRFELELFKMRRFVASQPSAVTPAMLKRLWEFYAISKRFEYRDVHSSPSLLSPAEDIAEIFLQELAVNEVVDASSTPFATVHCFIELAAVDSAFRAAAKAKGIRIDPLKFEGENPDFIVAGLERLGLSELLLIRMPHFADQGAQSSFKIDLCNAGRL